MRITRTEVDYLRFAGYGQFIKRSTGHSGNYHLLEAEDAVNALKKFHEESVPESCKNIGNK